MKPEKISMAANNDKVNQTTKSGDESGSHRNIQHLIQKIRNKRVVIDRDLAELYKIETKRLNEQVKRNIDRFPTHFRFQLTDSEKNQLVADCDRLKVLKNSSVNPYAFTELGIAMLVSVLKSKDAITKSIEILESI